MAQIPWIIFGLFVVGLAVWVAIRWYRRRQKAAIEAEEMEYHRYVHQLGEMMSAVSFLKSAGLKKQVLNGLDLILIGSAMVCLFDVVGDDLLPRVCFCC